MMRRLAFSSAMILASALVGGCSGGAGPAGPQGNKGDPGPAGAAGQTGATGPQGAAGASGPQGPAGPSGPSGVEGPTGPTGPAGPQGTQGVAGPAGAAGATGATGANGAAGQSVTVATEAPGANCSAGGVKISSTSGDNYVCNGGSTNGRVMRWAQWSSFDQSYGWMGSSGNGDSTMFGGVTPQAWGDGSAIGAQMTDDAETMRTLFNKKMYPGANANVMSDTWYNYSSTNSRHTGVLMRIKNSTNNPIYWALTFHATCYVGWGELASVALNGQSQWQCTGDTGSQPATSLGLNLPANKTSTVIVIAGSDPASGYRTNYLAFTNNTLTLPSGASFVDDIDGINGPLW